MRTSCLATTLLFCLSALCDSCNSYRMLDHMICVILSHAAHSPLGLLVCNRTSPCNVRANRALYCVTSAECVAGEQCHYLISALEMLHAVHNPVTDARLHNRRCGVQGLWSKMREAAGCAVAPQTQPSWPYTRCGGGVCASCGACRMDMAVRCTQADTRFLGSLCSCRPANCRTVMRTCLAAALPEA